MEKKPESQNKPIKGKLFNGMEKRADNPDLQCPGCGYIAQVGNKIIGARLLKCNKCGWIKENKED